MLNNTRTAAWYAQASPFFSKEFTGYNLAETNFFYPLNFNLDINLFYALHSGYCRKQDASLFFRMYFYYLKPGHLPQFACLKKITASFC
ncbi:MAG: hypothetical protein CME16_06080 [Gemmatimonadetes bacterium]|nr:hypothetical protein [Gemmatimonadota bacterium]